MKTRRFAYRMISIILTLAMLLSFSASALAVVTSDSMIKLDADTEVLMEMGDTRIEYYETPDGDQVFLQYVNDVLDQINTIPANSDDIVVQDVDASNNSIRTTYTIDANDYITETVVGESVSPLATTVNKGTINYRAIVDSGYTYYGLRCSYTYSSGNSTYSIKSFAGKLVDLVTLILAVIPLPSSIATSAIRAICVSAGISIVGGALSKALTTTMACVKTSYTWTLTDTTNSSHTGKKYGNKYYITDSVYNTGNTYTDGWTPDDWRTSGLASSFHDHMFSYSAWNVVSWS